jgi:L-alanine-DL-glutamate epimerase-like enolase superfamily enzyme
MLMGDFENIFVTNTLANTLNIKLVYTTLLESAVGRAATAAISAGSGNDIWAHGLSTGKNLAADVSPEQWLNKPEISFPDEPGLGISLNTDLLNEV